MCSNEEMFQKYFIKDIVEVVFITGLLTSVAADKYALTLR